MINIPHLLRWFETRGIGGAVSGSTYLFPAIEVVHLMGLVLLLGSVIVMSMRLLGFGMTRQSIPQIANSVRPLTWLGIGLMLASGIPLFLAEARKCYDNPSFAFKMASLVLALLFQATVLPKVTSADSIRPAWAKLTGLVSLALWFAVGVGGRVIAFI